MDLTQHQSLSCYRTVATLNEEHGITLVQHCRTNKICVKKQLSVYHAGVYRQLAALRPAGIPAILEFEEDGDQLILLEEYISGSSLLELMDSGTLTEEDIVSYLRQLCGILEQLHGLCPPIVHRDIKPSNIMVDHRGNVILLDFNAAKQVVAEQETDTVLLGTQGYAAPEQYGFGASTPQTDIYAIGILLRELVRSMPVPTHRFDEVIAVCTRLDRAERFCSVSELAAALGAAPETVPTRPQKDWQRFLLPGFRTGKFWKMLTAAPVYLLIFWMGLTLEVKNMSGIDLWLERGYLMVSCLAAIGIGCNYLDVCRYFPLYDSRYPLLRILGRVLFFCLVFFALSVFLFVFLLPPRV